ncbi:MAG: sodium ion-translocating decarboxylase subunit beta [Candidatus Zixiibacteriota bacterium]
MNPVLNKMLNSSGFSEIINNLPSTFSEVPTSSIGNLIMVVLGLLAIYFSIKKDYEPLLLIPIGFGIVLANIPHMASLPIGVYDGITQVNPTANQLAYDMLHPEGNASVFSFFYFLVRKGILPPLVFLGLGAMTDFTNLISNPKSVLLGAAAQFGVFITFFGALLLGFDHLQAASIGIIGGADGPTAIFTSSQLAPKLLGPIAIAGYSYIALVPVIQPPFMKLLTSKKERLIKMKPAKPASKVQKTIFPIIVFILAALIAPGSMTLIGMLMLGNLLKENGLTDRLARSASNALIDSATILLAFSVGASTEASVFLQWSSFKIFILGLLAFSTATCCGLLFAKFMNLFLKTKINPLIGAAGVSAVPDSSRVAQKVAQEEDPNNFILMHAMGPNVAGVIGSAIAAGIFLSLYK